MKIGVEMCIAMKYALTPNASFTILHISLAIALIYCRYTSVVVKLFTI
jgi:hypothetical protein